MDSLSFINIYPSHPSIPFSNTRTIRLQALLKEEEESNNSDKKQNSTESFSTTSSTATMDPTNDWISQAVLSEGASIMELELKEHKPLGCTVEESACPEENEAHPVFVSKITTGGNAEKAGLQVGDVILGISGIFNEIEDVSEQGLTRVRSLVSGRFPENPLQMRILRGTSILERHESYLVTLCTLPGGTDDDLNDCLDAILGDTYETSNPSQDDESICENGTEEDGECMLDTMFEAWGDEILENIPKSDPKSDSNTPTELEIEKMKKEANARPWASRSSPSGTYVRDPTTGEMKNIG